MKCPIVAYVCHYSKSRLEIVIPEELAAILRAEMMSSNTKRFLGLDMPPNLELHVIWRGASAKLTP